MSDLRGTWIARRFVSRVLVFVVLIFLASEVRQAYRPGPGNAALAGPHIPGGPGPMPPIGGEPGEIGTEDLNESAPDDPCDETGPGGDSDNTLSDPVNLSTGEFTLRATDLVIPGRGFDFVLKRTYRSRSFSLFLGGYGNTLNFGAIMGFNWDMSYNIFLVSGPNSLIFHDGTGRKDTFVWDAVTGKYGRDEYFRTITLNPDGSFTMLQADGTRWEFAPLNNKGTTSKITAIVDRNGNTMTFEYETLPDDGAGMPYQGLLTTINDTLDSVTEISGGPQLHTRSISFHYESPVSPRFLTSVTDWIGREVEYTYDSFGDLTSVAVPEVIGTPNGNDYFGLDRKTTTYEYQNGISEIVFFCYLWIVECDEFEPPFCWWVCETGYTFEVTRGLLNHNLTTITDAKGELILENNYSPPWLWASHPIFDRVMSQVYGGDRYDFTYSHVDPNISNGASRKTIVNNRMGQVKELFYDDKNRLKMRRDHTGLAYPASPTTDFLNMPGDPMRQGDPSYFETLWDYDTNSRKTRITHPNGNFETFQYDSGNPDRRLHGNLLEHIWEPGPLGGDQATITESFTYEPGVGGCCGLNFVKTHTDGRKNDGEVTVPAIQDTVNLYDTFGNRTQTTHRDGGVENWTYNGFGQVLTHTLPDNGSGHRRVDRYSYHPPGDLQHGYLKEKIVDDGYFGLTTIYNYDDVGNVILKTDPRDNATEYVVNQLNQVVQETSRPVQTINADGTIGPATAGYVRSIFYDKNNNIVQLNIDNIDEAGIPDVLNPTLTTTYEYDFLNFMTRKTEEVNFFKSVVTEYSYNKNKKLTQVLYGEATSGNQPNNSVSGIYDERSLLFTATRAAGDADQSSTQYDYDGNKNLTTITQGIEDIVEPRITTGIYDGYNRLVTSIDAMGNVITLGYDANHNRTSTRVDGETIDASGGAGNVRLSEIAYAYDPMDRIIQGGAAFFDAAGVPINTPGDTTPGLSRLTITYSDSSQILSIIDDDGDITTATYDTANRRSVITDARTNTLTNIFDANSNVTQTIEADKSDLIGGATETFTTTYGYDNLDRLITIADNVGNTDTHGYDSRNNHVLMIDALSNETRYVYDGLNRLITTIRDLDGDGADGDGTDVTTAQDWDDSSRLISRTDDNDNETRYEYDPLNRVTAQVFADCTQTGYVYDVHDNPGVITDANSNDISCSYDRLDRLISKVIAPGAGVADWDNGGTTFEIHAYDGLSRLVTVNDNDSVVFLSYDSLSNVTEETQLIAFGPAGGSSGTVTATYDGESNLLSCTYPGGRTIGCTYDVLDRKATITDDTAAQPGPMIADYKYVGRYRVAQRDYGNNTRMTYAYDGITGTANLEGDFGDRQVVRTTHTFDPGVTNTILDNRTYTWDKMFNKTRREDVRPGGPRLRHDYTYDPAYRLTHTVASFEFEPASYVTVRDTTYNLDGVHNRLSTSGTVNGMSDPATGIYTMNDTVCTDLAMNKYTTTPLDARGYDPNGNLTSILGNDAAGNALAVSCMYDYRDQMVEYRDATTGQRHTYAYDTFGRRIIKTIDADGGAGGPTRTLYFYGGETREQVCEEQDAAGTTAATYVYGRYIDEVLQTQRGGIDYYYHADDLYNVMAVTDSTGTVVERYEYGDYGQPTIMDASGNALTLSDGTPLTSSPIANPYLFTGRRYDPESGWYNYRTRYLDPLSGKFTTRDTIGIWGDPWEFGNGYSFVGNGPFSWIDPFGLGKVGFFIKTVKGIYKWVRPGTARKAVEKGKDVLVKGPGASRKAKKVGKDTLGKDGRIVRHDGHKPGQYPHYQLKSGDCPHIKYKFPGAALGPDIFGDGWIGEIVTFFNPLSDVQDIIDLFQDEETEEEPEPTGFGPGGGGRFRGAGTGGSW